jgi:CO dehydrogenase/acetyl-CoA synthase beta subunit
MKPKKMTRLQRAKVARWLALHEKEIAEAVARLESVYQAIEREPATPTLIDRIEAAMTSDEDRDEKQSEYLQTRYERADEQTKQAIDFCFVALCGWSLGTLIKGEEAQT